MASIIVVVVVNLPNDLPLVVVVADDGVLVVDAVDAAMPTRKGIGVMVIGGVTLRMSILTMVDDVVMLMDVARGEEGDMPTNEALCGDIVANPLVSAGDVRDPLDVLDVAGA